MGQLKDFLKTCLPKSFVEKISAMRMAAWRRKWNHMGHQERFDYIHRENRWGSKESVSGYGSTLKATEKIRAVLPKLLKDLKIKSMLDIPCGDFHWMKLLDLELDYIGGDIVQELVEENEKRYGSEKRRFVHLNLVSDDIPKVDAIFCRECLVHFCHTDVMKAVANIKRSGSKYLIVTTYTELEENAVIETGDWRAINFTKYPFNWPVPIFVVNDASSDDPENAHSDKSMGVWRIADLPV